MIPNQHPFLCWQKSIFIKVQWVFFYTIWVMKWLWHDYNMEWKGDGTSLSLIIHSTSSSTVGGLVIGRSAHSAYPVLGISYLKLHLGKVRSDTLRVLNVTRMRLSWFSVERYSFLGVNILFFFSVDHDKQSSHGLLSWYYSYLTISGQTCLVDKSSDNP